jgi:two-component system LytT family sensor kinase
LRSAGLVFAFFSFLAVLLLPQIYFFNSKTGASTSWTTAFMHVLVGNYLWAALTPLIFRLGNRFPIERPRIILRLSIHFIISLALSALHTIVFHLVLMGVLLGATWSAIYGELFGNFGMFLGNLTNGFIFYTGILAVNHAAIYARRYKDREFQLQQSELTLLKTQLHPHFLFNTLNAISALVYVSPPDATKTIAQLSDLLRLTLRSGKSHKVSLKDEIEFLKKYLQIQQTLFGDRLDIYWDVDPATLDALVPNMILQPIVENSIRHGIAPKKAGGSITVSTGIHAGVLALDIVDDGVGFAIGGRNSKPGIGLANTRMRLTRLYGGNSAQITAEDVADGGVAVRIKIPFEEERFA